MLRRRQGEQPMKPPDIPETAHPSDGQLRVLRAQAARLAKVSADHWPDALAVENHLSAGYWSMRYKRAAARCVALGDLLRGSDRVRPRRDLPVLGNRG
jgi:hypothetical protein